MMTDLASTTPQSLGRDSMVGMRLARVDGFEPAIALGQDELPAYLRRFTMLFADDATIRRGGIGRVTRAVNAQGEAVALKQLILPTRDEFDDDATHEALVAKFKAAFREEYECHRALSGLKGFPRLYGWGEVDGVWYFSKISFRISSLSVRARRSPACVRGSPWTMPDACRRLWRRVWVATCSVCSVV